MKHEHSIIRGIRLTEKGTVLSEQNKYTVEVDRTANKIEIRKAVQDLFNVTVLAVNTRRDKMKTRTLRNRRQVRKGDRKVAIVTLKEGDRIDIL